VSRLSRQCGILNISQPYRPTRPVTGIALLSSLIYSPDKRMVRIVTFLLLIPFRASSCQEPSRDWLVKKNLAHAKAMSRVSRDRITAVQRSRATWCDGVSVSIYQKSPFPFHCTPPCRTTAGSAAHNNIQRQVTGADRDLMGRMIAGRFPINRGDSYW
jgi:hypothetical protein